MHPRAKDITGFRVGYLTAVEYAGSDGFKSLWRVRCDCGNEVRLPATELKKWRARGIIASCGCRRKETIAARHTTHGRTDHPLFGVWRGLVRRCYQTTHHAYPDYGGRGIQVCTRWRDSFQNFWDDMAAAYSPGLTIDRLDNDGDYTPDNCAWHTSVEQANNTRRTVWLDTPHGRMTLSSSVTRYGIKRNTIRHRLQAGWTVTQALTTPVGCPRADKE